MRQILAVKGYEVCMNFKICSKRNENTVTFPILVLLIGILLVTFLSYDVNFNVNKETRSSVMMDHVQDCTHLTQTMHKSGVYHIYPNGEHGYKVYCDLDTDGGGWTVFQYRSGGLVNFHTKQWKDCKNGFGDISAEHWLGNERVHQLTRLGNNVLRIDLEDWEGNSRYAVFTNFTVDNESSNYRMSYGTYSGNATNCLTNKAAFTTIDRQNDGRPTDSNCAIVYGGPWWYDDMCGYSDLNGQYVTGGKGLKISHGLMWYHWRGNDYSMKVSKMMIRKM